MRAYNGYQDKEGWAMLVKRAMESDCSWSVSAKEYIRMYENTMSLWHI
jgi:starch synthase